MSKPSISHEQVKAILMQDEDFKTEYDSLKPRYEMITQLIEARTAAKITQAELAARIGTKRSNISRLESGKQNISIDFLAKVAKGLGKELQVSLK